MGKKIMKNTLIFIIIISIISFYIGFKNIFSFEPVEKRNFSVSEKAAVFTTKTLPQLKFSKDEIIFNNLFHPQRGVIDNTTSEPQKLEVIDPNINKVMHNNKELKIFGILTYKNQKMIIISQENSQVEKSKKSSRKGKILNKKNNLLKVGDSTSDGSQLIEIFRDKAIFKKNKKIIDIKISRRGKTKVTIIKPEASPIENRDNVIKTKKFEKSDK